MDGWITIGAKLDTKQLAREIKEMQNELKSVEKEGVNLQKQKTKEEEDLRSMQMFLDYYKEQIEEEAKLASTEEEANQIRQQGQGIIEASNGAIEQSKDDLKQINEQLENNKKKQEDIKNEIIQTEEKLHKQEGMKNVQDYLKDIKNTLGNTIKGVVKWGLALLGISGVFSFIRSSMSVISQYDKQLGADIQYIRYAIAMTLKPVIEYIVNLVYKLLGYLQYIIHAWTGYNIFKNSSKGAYTTLKGVKAIKKELAGFDEMNVLNGNNGAGGGGASPSMDLSKLQQGNIPPWVEWIATHGELVREIIEGIAIAIASIKLASLISGIAGITGSMKLLLGLGIGVALYGIVETIINIINYLNNPTWDNAINIFASLSVAIMGAGVAMLAFNATNPVGWITIAIGAIGLLATALIDLDHKLFGDVVETRNLEDAQKALKKSSEDLQKSQLELANAYDNVDRQEKELNKLLKDHRISQEQYNDIVKKGDKNYRDLNTTEKEIYKQHLRLEEANKQLTKAQENNDLVTKQNVLDNLALQKANLDSTESYNDYKKAVIDAYNEGSIKAGEAGAIIEEVTREMSDDFKQTFTKDLPKDIQEGFDASKQKNTINKWKNGIISYLQFASPVKLTINLIPKLGEALGKLLKNEKGAIAYYKKGGIVNIPRLARGGVINQPGRGVPLTNAIAGEHGAEGVIPLTDSQQMSLLGEAIGKYITINANITNTMNGRVISRELQKVQNDSDFAYNR